MYRLPTCMSPTHSNSFPATVVIETALGRSVNSSFNLSPTETTNHCIELNEGGSSQNEHNGVPSMKSNSLLDWMETMNQQSRIEFECK